MMRRRILLFSLAAITLGAGVLVWRRGAPPMAPGTRLFADVLAAVRTYYVDSLGDADLYLKASRGIVQNLGDPYSALLGQDQVRDFQRRLAGVRVGVGIRLDQARGRLLVDAVAPGSPARRAGIQPGDEIIAIDDTTTTGWTASDGARALRGDAGTAVMLLVARAGEDEARSFRLTRGPVYESAVQTSLMLDRTIGYVSLPAIGDRAAADLHRAVDQLVTDGATHLVLDLRRNPGGAFDEGIRITDLFLDRGLAIGALRSQNARQSRRYAADIAQPWPELPLVVLVNGGTASSAEIIAGALQDHRRAVVVGMPTFGKGAVQATIPIGRDLALKLTTARWFTPGGRALDRAEGTAPGDTSRSNQAGIHPDVLIPGTGPTQAERALLEYLGPDLVRFRAVIGELAVDPRVAREVQHEEFKVSSWLRTFVRRELGRSGTEVPSAVWQDASGLVDREIGIELVRRLFGEASARRRGARHDAQLVRALDLLRDAESQASVAARASALETIPLP